MNRRAYSSEVRTRRAAATRARILEAAQELFVDREHDFTLDRVAKAADVSVQTVLRAFGSREGLVLAAIGTMREREDRATIEPATTIRAAIAALFDDYERARSLLESWRRQASPWYVTWSVFYEFMRVAGHPRVFRRPWPMRKTLEFVDKTPGKGDFAYVVTAVHENNVESTASDPAAEVKI